ncbi:MAG: DNA-3-methyladenine glycosylase [Candidatus Sungiibacteriota bacterium]
MRHILTRQFFDRPTLKVAKELLGKFLVRKVGRREIAGMITEVEAYVGQEDKASHASRGETPRCRVMFGEAGNWYLYFTYGMHWMLNIVTERKGYPAAVLIRGTSDIYGPGRLTKFLHVDKSFNGKPAKKDVGLWIEDRGAKIPKLAIRSGKRIGVEYALEPWKNKPWRFYIGGH